MPLRWYELRGGPLSEIDLNTSLIHWAEQWSQHRDVTTRRQRADEHRVETYIKPYIGDKSVTRITHRQIVDWLDALEASGVGRATLYASLMIVRQSISLAYETMGITRANPAKPASDDERSLRNMQTFRQPDEAEILGDGQVQNLLEAIDPYFRALVHLSVETGAKWEEAVGLREQDLDLILQRVTLGAMRIISEPGGVVAREGESRAVPISTALAADLKRHLLLTDDWRTAENNYMFLTKRTHTHVLSANFTHHVWRPALWQADLNPKLTFHSLRHTAAVRMIEQDVPAEEIARRLGHKAVTTTKGMYQRYFKS